MDAIDEEEDDAADDGLDNELILVDDFSAIGGLVDVVATGVGVVASTFLSFIVVVAFCLEGLLISYVVPSIVMEQLIGFSDLILISALAVLILAS